ncbi:Rpn family recombination-promoting nuclease/putative transposase [Parablautia sp. Marseille-Q6255]|uniref:Rpn family recombination-promoting nuclease/putative transposase n=1 Tax=Parablautia sp. Marseille-Q6255 TaxID=3039593 RepID=UPI0024BC9025|nr:Rpn family recombination-promoting nuclease/putative transposase [Parablautia sp. Marseille-Q6255]
MSKENRNYRDSVFVDLFFRYQGAKENALSLYNALSGSHYDNPEEVRMLKLEDVMYKDFQNDISFLIREKIFVLGEHQSTINENMPLRFLLYIGRLYETLLAVEDRYKEKRIPLPAPEFYVFYNGEKKYPAYKLLKLSDSFLVKGRPTFDLEVTVHVYNLNKGMNTKLLEECPILKEYCEFADVVSKYKGQKEKLKAAIEECIQKGILTDYLSERGSEVTNMLIAQYDYEKDIEVKKKEAREEGKNEGEKYMAKLVAFLCRKKRYSDLERIEDPKSREKLLAEMEAEEKQGNTFA